MRWPRSPVNRRSSLAKALSFMVGHLFPPNLQFLDHCLKAKTIYSFIAATNNIGKSRSYLLIPPNLDFCHPLSQWPFIQILIPNILHETNVHKKHLIYHNLEVNDMLIGLFILALVVIIALIMLPRIRRWLKIRKYPQQKSLPDNYQCSLFDEKTKREACEKLMTNENNKSGTEKDSVQK
jgi:hypothetical protein